MFKVTIPPLRSACPDRQHAARPWSGLRGIALAALAVLATVSIARSSQASVVIGAQFPSAISTGERSFTIANPSPSTIDPGLTVLGSDIDNISLAANPSLIDPAIYTFGFNGEPFTAQFFVEGVGFLTFSETVGVTVSVKVNNTVLGSPETFSLNLSGTCGSETDTSDFNLCNAQGAFSAFSGSEAVVLPANTPISEVSFAYVVTQSDQQCTALTENRDHTQFTSACIEGYTNVTDGVTPGDPDWSASLVPEPNSLGLMAFAVMSMVGVGLWRRRRGVFATHA